MQGSKRTRKCWSLEEARSARSEQVSCGSSFGRTTFATVTASFASTCSCLASDISVIPRQEQETHIAVQKWRKFHSFQSTATLWGWRGRDQRRTHSFLKQTWLIKSRITTSSWSACCKCSTSPCHGHVGGTTSSSSLLLPLLSLFTFFASCPKSIRPSNARGFSSWLSSLTHP